MSDAPLITDGLSEPGFLCSSKCGREWFVPLEAVGRDYAEFLVTERGFHPEAAQYVAEQKRSEWRDWFYRKCTVWSIVEELGRQTKTPSGKTKRALDRLRAHHSAGFATSIVEVGLEPQNEKSDSE